MARPGPALRTYGTRTRTQTAKACISEGLPNHPKGGRPQISRDESEAAKSGDDEMARLTEQIGSVRIDGPKREPEPRPRRQGPVKSRPEGPKGRDGEEKEKAPAAEPPAASKTPAHENPSAAPARKHQNLRVLTWADVCPPGDRVEKIAEASYAEVYRVSNERGTSVIKVIRLESPIKPQTKAQERSGLVDEEPHREADLMGEINISEWLADIPGFVVYKERYVVRGRATKGLLEAHQTFHRRIKRKDPDRLQFYPSPSRYLHETEFLVIELGDAGTSLEDFELVSCAQLWDIFMLVTIALARAEFQIAFEHRDLHEGNLCVRRVRPASAVERADEAGRESIGGSIVFGSSGLDITILDYGLSRADNPDHDGSRASGVETVAFDLEKDLSLFTSTHAAQCAVYRRMRSFLIKGDRIHLPPEAHTTPYPLQDPDKSGDDDDDDDNESRTIDERISWNDYNPYSNVLWLAYLYDYLTTNFCGREGGDSAASRRDLARFRRETRELWAHLDPEAPPEVLSFASATDVVRFAVEAGWLTERQLLSVGVEHDEPGAELDPCESLAEDVSLLSIVEAHIVERDETQPRRSPRRRQRPVAVAAA